MRISRLLVLFSLVAARAAAQPAAPVAPDSVRRASEPLVTARFIPDSIGIGDHFRLRLEVTMDRVQMISFPEGRRDSTGHMLTQYIEVLEESVPDTVRSEGRRITIGKEWKLTCFEPGIHYLKRIPVLWAGKNIVDTVYARPDSIRIQVGTFEIDTLTQDIRDIKLPLAAPVRFGEFSGYLLGGLGILAALGALWWFLSKMRRERVMRLRRNEPPHLGAIRALEALHHQKLWQNNKHKQYYTLLADIIRAYIEGRFGIPAMEMTTDELLAALREEGLLPEKNRVQLASLLATADLAKFAKYAPPAEDNETCYNDAYYFVEDTKPEETAGEEEQEVQS